MAAPRYGSISAIGNRVTVVTCPMSAGSALAPRRGEVAAMLGRGRRPSCDVTSLSTRMSCRVEVTSAGREPPRGGYSISVRQLTTWASFIRSSVLSRSLSLLKIRSGGIRRKSTCYRCHAELLAGQACIEIPKLGGGYSTVRALHNWLLRTCNRSATLLQAVCAYRDQTRSWSSPRNPSWSSTSRLPRRLVSPSRLPLLARANEVIE